MNDDIPYDEYIEKREMGRAAVPHKRYWNKSLTVVQNFHITPKMEKKIAKLIPGIFPHKAEFYRYLIIKFFEDNPEWFK